VIINQVNICLENRLAMVILGDAEIYSPNEWLFQEDSEPCCAGSDSFHVLQFRQNPQNFQITPAMGAGLADHAWSLEEIAGLAK
jgi:hypothetical protein